VPRGRIFWLAMGMLVWTAKAQANGAFPGSLRVFAPPGAPEEILLATNFGLISTANGGQRWDWVCEHGDALLAAIYEIGPGARPRLYAAGPIGLAISTDGACSWTAFPEMQAAVLTGLFADPADETRVWVVARPRQAPPGDGFGLYLSTDGGATFGEPRYRVPLGSTIDSVESARTRPQRLYLTVSRGGQPPRVEIVRSDDGGTTFTVFDLSAATRGDQLRIAAVDPVDPDRLYLRVQGFPDERLVLSRDGGQTVVDALVIPQGRLSSFVRRGDGSLVAGGISDARGGTVHVSTDGGSSFELRSTAIRPGALAEREGVLWASTDNIQDGFALARSRDAASWEPVARYADVAGTKACPERTLLPQTCAAACIQELVRGVFSEQTCGASTPRPRPPDAGLPTPPTTGGGCGCHLAPTATPAAPLTLALLTLLLTRRSRRGAVSLPRCRPRPTLASPRPSSSACPSRSSASS
jgi:hypothetical protein